MFRFGEILKRLNDQGVEFIIIGGVAAALHGSPRTTLDLDVCAPLHQENASQNRDFQPPSRTSTAYVYRTVAARIPADHSHRKGISNDSAAVHDIQRATTIAAHRNSTIGQI